MGAFTYTQLYPPKLWISIRQELDMEREKKVKSWKAKNFEALKELYKTNTDKDAQSKINIGHEPRGIKKNNNIEEKVTDGLREKDR